MIILAFSLCAYLLGSISFAVVVSRFSGLADPRTYGSRNPGATNVLRSGNKKAAILTLLGDALKGWVAVFLAKKFSSAYGLDESGLAAVALAVFLGHLWPVFFRFQGGKGVATAAGVLLGINPLLGVGTLATWLIVAYAFRYSSLAALIASIFAPIWQMILFDPGPMFGAVTCMSVLLIYRHRENIANLMAGKEGRIGAKKSPAPGHEAHPSHGKKHGKSHHRH